MVGRDCRGPESTSPRSYKRTLEFPFGSQTGTQSVLRCEARKAFGEKYPLVIGGEKDAERLRQVPSARRGIAVGGGKLGTSEAERASSKSRARSIW